jgi:2-hydroxy-5-methyl-1-naphthoate 7-hydroxylase
VVAWAVARHDVLKRLLTDPRVSKDPRQHWTAWRDGRVPADWPLFTWVGVDNMFTAHGPDHRRLRTLAGQAFTARRTEALAPRIAEITRRLLAEIRAQHEAGEGPVDLRETFAYPLPIAVICDLYGVPETDREPLRTAVDGLFATSISEEEAARHQATLARVLTDLVTAKRREPADDLTTALIEARDADGSDLSERELLDTLFLMIGAGHETTVNLLHHAVLNLATHPEQLAHIRSGASTWQDAIDETLRHQAPVANLPLRYAVEDLELDDGTVIPAGDAILASYVGAGRDPGQHGPDADDFDITRATRGEHLSFGYGPHFCLGSALAQLEARIALPALFESFPRLAPTADARNRTPSKSFIANGRQALLTDLEPEPGQRRDAAAS